WSPDVCSSDLFQVAHPESLPAARQVAGGQTDRGSRGVDSATRRGGQTARYSKEQRSRMQESVGSRSTVPRTRRPGIRTNKDNQRTWKKIHPICPARLRLNVGNVGCYPTFYPTFKTRAVMRKILFCR